MTRCAPALRIAGAITASGAAAPNHTVSIPSLRMISAARRATNGVGNINVVRCRWTRYGCRASNSTLPFHRGA
ncbi:Uncharacterised protein [Mycobacteroides abscessus subsp. abscessus]|nr:Uncharacterised protein [Mycobacteroides abscessus subsp. abscessus]